MSQMKIKDKESFLQGMRYAAGIGPAQGLEWWYDVGGWGDAPLATNDEKQEFLMCFEQMMLGFVDLVDQEYDLDVLGVEFEN